MFSAFNPSKCTHLEQWAADCAAPGEQSWTSCRSRDSNPQPWVTSGRVSSPTLYPLGQRLPIQNNVTFACQYVNNLTKRLCSCSQGKAIHDKRCTMKVLLLLTLLTLCHAIPYTPINVMDFIKHHDIMQQDAGDFDDDDDDDDDDDHHYDDYDDNFVSDCPEGCRCSKKVLQCSDHGKNFMIFLQTTKDRMIRTRHFQRTPCIK